MPITPGGGDDNKNVEYVYIGCNSNTDISSATNKYQLSVPNNPPSSFRRLYPLANGKFGQFANEFIFSSTGIFFINNPLSTADKINVYTLKGYRTGGLQENNIDGYTIFCDKNNEILEAIDYLDIKGEKAPMFFPLKTNIQI